MRRKTGSAVVNVSEAGSLTFRLLRECGAGALTQTSLARAVGVSRPIVSHIEQGQVRRVDAETWGKLISFLGVSQKTFSKLEADVAVLLVKLVKVRGT